MKIAMIAPPIENVPPRFYGGTERVVSVLTEELVKRGHDVTLFASGNSKTSAKLVSVFDKPLREAYPTMEEIGKRIQMTLMHLGNAYSFQDAFDVIHDHTGYFGLPFAQSARVPVVSTIHGPLTKEVIPLYERFSKPHLVSISYSQRKNALYLNHAANIYNGLSMTHYPHSLPQKGYLLAVGRFSPEKGIHNAITIAQKLGLPLIIAAKLEEKNVDYFNEKIKPHLNKKIVWVGEVSETQRNRLMAEALCFLHPLEWEEPFGLTIIEAMACGTPVVAFNKGSMNEIILHGKTGFLAKNIDQAVGYIKNISQIDREYCRLYSLSNFSSGKMANEYESVYESLLTSLDSYTLTNRAKSIILKA
ncbi:MAG TPA: glycosyltransferase family 4 protein [Candidatus Eisenbacteria bacterium]|nr:glycosyltransferase family 4 protein [Candidatus Eisenbacteria bacterium]